MKHLADLSGQVIGCAIEVHKTLGPGLLESTYEHCLAYELSNTGLAFAENLGSGAWRSEDF